MRRARATSDVRAPQARRTGGAGARDRRHLAGRHAARIERGRVRALADGQRLRGGSVTASAATSAAAITGTTVATAASAAAISPHFATGAKALDAAVNVAAGKIGATMHRLAAGLPLCAVRQVKEPVRDTAT
ncbi:protein of unknown function (plasmid) [Ralstonia solanacearum PSI07]|nr:protein of unknown function [Ralstonia solanacearum PSI07]